MDTDMVTFLCRSSRAACFCPAQADSNPKKVLLGCGGTNPFFVLEGAEDRPGIPRTAAMVD